jgi:hypothetical protein
MKFISKFKLELHLAWQALVPPGHGILTDPQQGNTGTEFTKPMEPIVQPGIGFAVTAETVPFSTIQKSKNETDRNGRAVSVFMVYCTNPSVCIVYQPAFFTVNHSVFAVLCFLKKYQILNFIRSKINVLFKLDQISFY